MSNVYVEPDMQTSKLGDDVTTAADDTVKVHDVKLGSNDVKNKMAANVKSVDWFANLLSML